MMSDGEDDDQITDLVAGTGSRDILSTSEIQQILQHEKQMNPSKFVSHWEMDEEDVNLATEDDKQNNPMVRILWAAETGNTDVITEMIVEDANLVNAVDTDGYTPLHRAAYEGHVDSLAILLDYGANINAQTCDGWTALHSAVYWGQTAVVAMLIRRGASINARTNGQQTPLHLAAAAPNGGNGDVLQLLLMNEFIDTQAVNKLGETARVIAERSSRHRQFFDIANESTNVLLKT